MNRLAEDNRRVLEFINRVKDPAAIIKRYEMRRDELPSEWQQVDFSLPKARRIISERNAQSNTKFVSIEQLGTFVADLAIPVELFRFILAPPSKDYPVLLFPIRLETRFVEVGENFTKHWELRVRIYPDNLVVETHERALKEEERLGGEAYRRALAEAGNDEDQKRTAWLELAHRFGPERAAWIVRIGVSAELKDSDWTKAPTVRVLPERFIVCLYKGDQRIYSDQGRGEIIPDELQVIRAPDSPINDPENTLFDEESRWMFDFDDALARGMAVKFTLGGDDDLAFSRIVAVGLDSYTSASEGQSLVEELIDNHHYTSGFSFVPYGTPTNNTRSVRSGHSESTEEIDKSYDIEIIKAEDREGARSNAERLTRALGLGENSQVFDHVANVHDENAVAFKDLQQAVWPAIGDYFIRVMLPGDLIEHADRLRLWQHFYQYVSARGPLPAIRAGNLPYGILPVTKLSNWRASAFDDLPLENDPDQSHNRMQFDTSMHSVLLRLYKNHNPNENGKWKTWLDMALNSQTVPRMGQSGDPDQELLRILAMEPTATSYRVRPMVGDRLLGWLFFVLRRELFGADTRYVAGESVGAWLQRWKDIWRDMKAPVAELLKKLSGGADEIVNAPLLGLVSWGDGLNLPIPLAVNPDDVEDIPSNYLRELCQHGTGTPSDTSNTLLFELLRQALSYESTFLSGVPGPRDALKSAICRLANVTVLEDFNRFRDPLRIAARYKDFPRPGRGGPPPDYETLLSAAGELLSVRGELPGERFATAAVLELKLHRRLIGTRGFIYRFEEAGFPVDFEGLLRDTLDLCTHRLDAWLTSFATRRLEAMRKRKEEGVYMGAYGWVEDLQPPLPSDNQYIHAPSVPQAAAAAILRNAFLSHQDSQQGNIFRINLTSKRVRRAQRLIDGVRQGQQMGALLGYQFERGLHDRGEDEAITRFRSDFPLNIDKETEVSDGESVEAIAARNVVDGLALARDYERNSARYHNESSDDITAELKGLLNAVDSVADLFLWESAFQSVQGNYDRAGAALEAAAGVGAPPEIDSIPTPPSGAGLGHRVCVLLSGDAQGSPGPRGQAEPRLDHWFGKVLGDKARIACSVSYEFDLSYLNEGSATALEALGFSEAEAKLIVEDRTRRGDYAALDELSRIVDISEATLGQIRGSVPSSSRTITLDDLTVTIGPVVDPPTGPLVDVPIGALDFLYLCATPPVGEQTELEQLITKAAEEADNVPVWVKIKIDFDRGSPVFTRSMAEAVELGRTVLNLLGSSSFLEPETILPPDWQEEATLFTDDDYQELLGRVKGIKADLLFDPENPVPNPLDSRLSNAQDPDDIEPLLMEASRYGLEGAIPDRSDDDVTLRGRRDDVVAEIEKRVEACSKLLEKARGLANAPDYGRAIRELAAAMKALLGERFVVLPTFSVPDTAEKPWATELKAALAHPDILGQEGPQRIFLWLQQAAQTHLPLFHLEDVLLLAEAWSTAAVDGATVSGAELDQTDWQQSFGLKVYQLPHDDNRRWLALSDDELRRGKTQAELDAMDQEMRETGRPRDLLSVVCLAPNDLDVQKPMSGLMVDQWSELIPNESITSGVSLQYNHPNAQAPQALLLAVPEHLEEKQGIWTVDDLVDIVNDTIDLSKIRAVDLDALKDVGHIFPALFLPLDPDRFGWDREEALNTFQGWIDELFRAENCLNFEGFDENESFADREEKEYTFRQLGNSDPRVDTYAGDKVLEFGEDGIEIELPGNNGVNRVDLAVMNRWFSGVEVSVLNDQRDTVKGFQVPFHIFPRTHSFVAVGSRLKHVIIRGRGALVRICTPGP